MNTTRQPSNVLQRIHCGIIEAFGEIVLDALRDSDVVEVMINPDRTIWIDHRQNGRMCRGEMKRENIEAVIRLVAAHTNKSVNQDEPRISAMLPALSVCDDGCQQSGGLRFQGMWPPIVSSPSFVIRKLSSIVWTLDDYVQSEIATAKQIEMVRSAIVARKNILVAGGTGSGKTTLLNACLAEPGFVNSRLLILEDTEELQFAGKDSMQLLAEPPVTLCELVKSTLRLRPDRIVVGEVRGGEAFDMIKAWNTGHPGGICSLHANGPVEALSRLQDLACESAVVTPQKIANAIQLVVFIRRDDEHPARRVIEAVCKPASDVSLGFAVTETLSPLSV